MTIEKQIPKLSLHITGANSAINESEFLAITCNLLKARERSRVWVMIGFDFASRWLKSWLVILKPITARSKTSNRNRVITLESHLKTALTLPAITIEIMIAMLMAARVKGRWRSSLVSKLRNCDAVSVPVVKWKPRTWDKKNGETPFNYF